MTLCQEVSMKEQIIEKKEKKVKNERDMIYERLCDSMNKLRVVHLLRWNLNVIFSDVGDTSDYIEANEALSELERETWKYILEGFPN